MLLTDFRRGLVRYANPVGRYWFAVLLSPSAARHTAALREAMGGYSPRHRRTRVRRGDGCSVFVQAPGGRVAVLSNAADRGRARAELCAARKGLGLRFQIPGYTDLRTETLTVPGACRVVAQTKHHRLALLPPVGWRDEIRGRIRSILTERRRPLPVSPGTAATIARLQGKGELNRVERKRLAAAQREQRHITFPRSEAEIFAAARNYMTEIRLACKAFSIPSAEKREYRVLVYHAVAVKMTAHRKQWFMRLKAAGKLPSQARLFLPRGPELSRKLRGIRKRGDLAHSQSGGAVAAIFTSPPEGGGPRSGQGGESATVTAAAGGAEIAGGLAAARMAAATAIPQEAGK